MAPPSPCSHWTFPWALMACLLLWDRERPHITASHPQPRVIPVGLAQSTKQEPRMGEHNGFVTPVLGWET